LKVIFKDPEVPQNLKNELLETTLAGDSTDLATNTRLTCEAAIPTAESKEKVW
jgi:hypothetical protein